VEIVSRSEKGVEDTPFSIIFKIFAMEQGKMKILRKLFLGMVISLLTGFWGLRAENKVVEKVISVSEDKSFVVNVVPGALLSGPSRLETAGGRIYILDSEESQVKVFDFTGKFIRAIGRRGKGPGEFSRPEGFFVERHKKLLGIADTGNRRIQVVNEEGQLLTSGKLTYPPCGLSQIDDKYYVASFPGSSVTLGEEPLINVYQPDFKFEKGFYKAIKTEDLMLNMLINTILIKADRAGNLVCAHQFGLNKILVFDAQGTMIRNFEIIYKGEKPEVPVLKMRIRSDRDAQKMPYILADMTFDARNYYYFLGGEMGQGPDGRTEKGREIYKYDSQGRYQGTIILPCEARLIAVGDDGALYLVDDNYELRRFVFRGK